METTLISVANIEIGERHRALSDDAVKRLAASMSDMGLRSPITIRVVDDYVLDDGEICDGVPVLVAGAHRLAAAKLLGWTHIDCIDADDDAITAELWELAENLHRLDLTKEQRDNHLRRYVELLQARRDASKTIDAPMVQQSPRAAGRPKSVITEAAEETGLSRMTIQRAVNRVSRADPPKEVFDVHEQARRRMMSAWNGATEEDRQWFRDWIDAPIMDAL